MTAFKSIDGGFKIRPEDQTVLFNQRAITKQVNDKFIQVGAVFLKMSSKLPIDDDWAKRSFRDCNLQDWIDDEEQRLANVGFNLQFGWTDIDIDADDPEYNRCMIAAMDYLRMDTRFRFGRKSVGYPTHVLVQLGEEESSNFEYLTKFEPREFRIDGKRFHTQIRSFPTNTTEKNLVRSAKQTVMPGSIYAHKKTDGDYDISVWYSRDGAIADNVRAIAGTTPRRVNFNEIVRAIAFATCLYVFKSQWVEGSRQATAQKVTGWLARLVKDSQAMNNQEAIASDVFCPIDDDSIAESLLHFVCEYMGDEERHMRVRAYHDARDKLERNPDAKIPGWPAMDQLFGQERSIALRTVVMPGSDVSQLTRMAERYLYDEADNKYIDRERFLSLSGYVHDGNELERRHKGDVVRVSGKPREAFKVFEASDMRKRVGMRDLYPDLAPGQVYRISVMGEVLNDDADPDPTALPVFNTWRGWPVVPTHTPDKALLEKCHQMLDRLLDYLTRDNPQQKSWMLMWLAWTWQHPGKKQQIAPVIVGGQGVGKSFFGNVFMKALMGRLWGTASPKVMEGAFSVEPFVDKMVVFIDEAKFHGDASTDEIKKMIRNVDIGGSEKFQSARNYRIFSRVIFASNRFDMNIGQTNVRDRALFYMRAYDKDHLNMTEMQFREWTETLKPFFDEFGAMLERRDVREHFVHMFMTMPVDRHEIESITHSSASDPDIVASNMGWSRRIAKYILEDGRIYEDLDIAYPFFMPDFNRRVGEVCKELGMQSVHGQRVFNEFKEAGLIDRYVENGRIAFRFKYKIGTLVELFGKSNSIDMEPRFEFTENDMGDNDTTFAQRVPWKGAKASFQKF